MRAASASPPLTKAAATQQRSGFAPLPLSAASLRSQPLSPSRVPIVPSSSSPSLAPPFPFPFPSPSPSLTLPLPLLPPSLICVMTEHHQFQDATICRYTSQAMVGLRQSEDSESQIGLTAGLDHVIFTPICLFYISRDTVLEGTL